MRMLQMISEGEKKWRQEIQALYLRAFPACERKDFGELEQKAAVRQVDIIAFERDGCFCGLAISVRYKDIVLLDYFAMSEECRGQGCGSQALALLCQHYQDRRFILEVESTRQRASNALQRKKRKTFYRRNGWSELGMLVFIFETEMEVLGYQCRLSFTEYQELYQNRYPERIPVLLPIP